MSIMSKNKSKNNSNKSNNDLKNCKYCGIALNRQDIQATSKKKLDIRYGVYWTGEERPFIQLYRVQCPSATCKKKYSTKEKKSTWFYA